MRPVMLIAPLAIVGVLAAGTGCNRASSTDAGPTPTLTPVLGESTTPAASGSPGATKTTSSAPVWPTPEDCISYNPMTLTSHYEAGIYAISDGSKNVMLLPGGPSENVGDKGLALAQHYRKHCFLGRGNTREFRNSYIFDYWRDASGLNPPIADQEDDCSDYNRNNLTVEDMGDGNGWRVKDHDHVLHLFDNESDARNGKLVLAKYHKICFIGNSGDDDPDLVDYLL